MRFERASVANNDCMHLVKGEDRDVCTVVLKGRNGLVSANYFRSLARPRCVRFETNNAIFIGNFYREKWEPANAVSPAMAVLNVQI